MKDGLSERITIINSFLGPGWSTRPSKTSFANISENRRETEKRGSEGLGTLGRTLTVILIFFDVFSSLCFLGVWHGVLPPIFRIIFIMKSIDGRQKMLEREKKLFL